MKLDMEGGEREKDKTPNENYRFFVEDVEKLLIL